jgi:hypothetical protein
MMGEWNDPGGLTRTDRGRPEVRFARCHTDAVSLRTPPPGPNRTCREYGPCSEGWLDPASRRDHARARGFLDARQGRGEPGVFAHRFEQFGTEQPLVYAGR